MRGMIAQWVVWCLLSTAAAEGAQESSDFLRLLAARDNSIASYEISTRQGSFDLRPEDYNNIREAVRKAAAGQVEGLDPAAWAQKLIQTWGKDPHWIERHMIQRGDCFKEVLTQDDQVVGIDLYDGLLYYDYAKRNDQLDVYAKMPNIGHINLQSLGVMTGGLSSRPKPVASPSPADPPSFSRDFGHDFELRHWEDAPPGQVPSTETSYLFHTMVDGYPVPRVVIYLYFNRTRNLCGGRIYLVDKARVNNPVSADDLSLGPVPPRALVIDYRFGLPRQWHYEEYGRSLINKTIAGDDAAQAQEVITLLDQSKGERQAALARDSRIGGLAPALDVKEWLPEAPVLEKWPPGRPVILEFWDIACGPCVGSIPENNKLAQWIQSRGGLFLSIHTVQHEPAGIREFLKTHEVHYAVGWDKPGPDSGYWGSATCASYGINGVPAWVTIGRSGRILSYDRLPLDRLAALLEKEPNEVPRSRPGLAARPVVLLPRAWLASDLEPGTKAQGRLLLFRPDTPDLKLRLWKNADRVVEFTTIQHSANDQTVYEILFQAQAPSWGQTIQGRISLIAVHDQQETLLEIPYELASRSLVQCAIPALWFGSVRTEDAVARQVPLRLAGSSSLAVVVEAAPAEVRVRVRRDADRNKDAEVTVEFSSSYPGLHEGTITLLASDQTNNRQRLQLGYCAFVRP